MATLLANPEAIREMLEQQPDVLSAAESRRRLVGVLPPRNVPYQQGPAHARARKALGRAFAYASNDFDLVSPLESTIERLRAGISLEQAVVDFYHDSAGRFVLGQADEGFGAHLKEAVRTARQIKPFVLAIPVLRRLPGTARQFRRLAAARDAFLQIIDARLDRGESGLCEGSLALGLQRQGLRHGMNREEMRDNLGMVAMATAFNLQIVLVNVIHALADHVTPANCTASAGFALLHPRPPACDTRKCECREAGFFTDLEIPSSGGSGWANRFYLSPGDDRDIFRRIGECRDLEADPIAWRLHLLTRLCDWLGARVGTGGEAFGIDRGRFLPTSTVGFGGGQRGRGDSFQPTARSLVNKPQSEAEVDAIRRCLALRQGAVGEAIGGPAGPGSRPAAPAAGRGKSKKRRVPFLPRPLFTFRNAPAHLGQAYRRHAILEGTTA